MFTAFALWGCEPSFAEATPVDITTKTVSPISQANSTSMPTETQISQLDTLEPTLAPTTVSSPTSTQMVSIEEIRTCPNQGMPVQLPDDFGLPGTILYQQYPGLGLFTVGSNPLVYSQLPVDETQAFEVFGFSPDGRWLAFSPVMFSEDGNIVFDNPSLILVSHTGERIEHTLATNKFQTQIPENNHLSGFGFGYWVNDSILYTYLNIEIPPDWVVSRYNGLSSIIDPFNGRWQLTLPSELPGLSSKGYLGFSPDMKRVLYQTTDGLMLLDLDEKTEIWSKQSAVPAGILIRWSPDSTMVAYAILDHDLNKMGFFVLADQGRREELIFGSKFGFNLWTFSWSPDSRYLAIVGRNELGENSLFVHDTSASQYTLYCPITGFDNVKSLHWSPDGDYIAYAGLEGPLRVLNLQSGTVFEIAQNAIATGWSNEFPVIWP